MKKLLIAVLLLAVVLAVSYVKSMRQEARVDAAHKSGYAEGAIGITEYRDSLDSLSQAVDSLESAMSETLAGMDSEHRQQVDSLASVVASRDKEIESLKKAAAASKTTARASKTTTPKKKEPTQHEILAFYKQKYDGLPADLSPYERQVAVSEIREETAKKFSITVARLNNIRKINKIDY